MLRKMDDHAQERISNFGAATERVVVKTTSLDLETINNRIQRGDCSSTNQFVSAGQVNPFQLHDINSILTATGASRANKESADVVVIVVGLSLALKSVIFAWLWQPHN
jgi:hypothetical protein